MDLFIEIKVLSPLHLGSGKADVNVDADVVTDSCGMPYFPARRFKGLLAESATEIREMGERSGLEPFCSLSVEELFHHETDRGNVQLIVQDFHLFDEEEYARVQGMWKMLQSKYSSILTPQDLTAEYTSVRYQTRLTKGVAAKGSLHNLRVVEAGISFRGNVELIGSDAEKYLPLLAAALRNLTEAGGKRNRGFGRIRCTMKLSDGRTDADILKEALA